MIYSNSEMVEHIVWTPDENPDGGAIARRFLEGERELLHIAHARSTVIVALTTFLESAGDGAVVVDRGTSGDLLISTSASRETLLLTGKTAEVLRAYLDDEPVSMDDRADMTVRRRIA